MKSYTILKFKDKHFNIEYELNPITGLYEHNTYGAKPKSLHPNCLICDGGFEITSIKDNNRDKVFTVGKEFSRIPAGYFTINTIRFASVKVEKQKYSHYTVLLNEIDIKEYDDMRKKEVAVAKPLNTEATETDPFAKLEEKILKIYGDETLKFGGDFKRKLSEKKPEFMLKFFERNDAYETIFTESKKLQCNRGCRRSLGDIYMILKYYYPRCTLASIIPYFYGKDKLKTLASQFCGSTQKRVFREGYAKIEGHEYHPTSKDEFGNLPSFYENLIK